MPSITLEVVIGMVFLYVLLSLVATAVTEWIARFTAQRSRTLEVGIRTLLSDPNGTDLTKRLYEHPLIQGLFPNGKKPSYIPAQTFAIALMDLLHVGTAIRDGAEPIAQVRDAVAKLPDGDAKTAAGELVNALALLTTAAAGQAAQPGSGGVTAAVAPEPLLGAIDALRQASGGNVDTLRTNIENWFDAAMERLSGWYKRWAQVVTLLVGLGVVVALNADSVMISNGLARDPALSAAVVAAASGASKEPLSNLDLKKVEQQFQQLKLPIGWSTDPSDPRGIPNSPSTILAKVAGLLLTALAISLGAPFWFDALNKLVNLRATGDPPPVSKPESRQPA